MSFNLCNALKKIGDNSLDIAIVLFFIIMRPSTTDKENDECLSPSLY